MAATNVTHDDDRYYNVNQLSDYSFGEAQQAIPHEFVDPLSSDPVLHHNLHNHFDLTPRASLADDSLDARSFPPAVSHHPYDPRSDDDAVSHHTFGTSSPSTSATSLFSSDRHRRTTSAATTDNESSSRARTALTSDDDDDNLNDYDDELDDEFDDPAYAIEIGSAQYDDESWLPNAPSTSTSASKRRESLPMAIPHSSSHPYDYDPTDNRSLLSMRRHSRSVDDDLPVPKFASDSPTSRVPTMSVPAPGGDWKHLWDKQSTRTYEGRGSVATVRPPPSMDPTPTFVQGHGNLEFELDADWSNMARGGIISLNQAEFSGPDFQGPIHVSPSQRKSSAISIATTTTLDDFFQKRVMGWDPETYSKERRNEWTFKREPEDGPGPIQSPIQTKQQSSKFPGIFGRDKERDKDKQIGTSSVTSMKSVDEEQERRQWDKERRAPENWYGMPMHSGEIWCNPLIGRYNVFRDSQLSSDRNKGPQQRLQIAHFRDKSMKLSHRAPSVTVHKHSRATAFSISRFYKYRPALNHPVDRSHPESSSIYPPPRESTSSRTGSKTTSGKHRSGTMILLAPKAVQLEYTSTHTTRKLAHHGLLNEQGPSTSSSSAAEEETEKRDKKKSSKKDKTNSRPGSAAGLTTMPTTAPMRPSTADEGQRQRSRRRKASMDSSDDERLPSRTPHSETYSSLAPNAIDQYFQEAQSSHQGSRLLGRVLSSRPTHGQPTANFNPPWMTLNPRMHQEQQKNTIHNLQRSFIDVGLVATKDNARDSGRRQSLQHDRRSFPATTEVFDAIDAESLFMVLPLWPGETDQHSRNRDMTPAPDVPVPDRLYLLVVYKAKAHRSGKVHAPQPSKSKKKAANSKSLTGSDSREDERHVHILLSAFTINARVVTHADLSGSFIRVPEKGISVCGPMKDATRSAPKRNATVLGFQMIANCASREKGIEFDMSGMDALGLCGSTDVASNGESLTLPTPIGRAVMEMAWIGGMALTSFGNILS